MERVFKYYEEFLNKEVYDSSIYYLSELYNVISLNEINNKLKYYWKSKIESELIKFKTESILIVVEDSINENLEYTKRILDVSGQLC
jgi:hypothetical protein